MKKLVMIGCVVASLICGAAAVEWSSVPAPAADGKTFTTTMLDAAAVECACGCGTECETVKALKARLEELEAKVAESEARKAKIKARQLQTKQERAEEAARRAAKGGENLTGVQMVAKQKEKRDAKQKKAGLVK